MRKKTLRIILTQECHYYCNYCCNKLPEVQEKIWFKSEKEIADMIRSKGYSAICLTGGEPLLEPQYVGYFSAMAKDYNMPIYLYTDGLLLSKECIKMFDGINIGIHKKNQIRMILKNMPGILTYKNIRLRVEDTGRYELANNIPDEYIKTWTMNNCNNSFEYEDFVELKQ